MGGPEVSFFSPEKPFATGDIGSAKNEIINAATVARIYSWEWFIADVFRRYFIIYL